MALLLNVPDGHKGDLAQIAQRLGICRPGRPSSPSISGLAKRLAERYKAEPEPTIALVAAALGIDEIEAPAEE
jgi:hypothetical protein